MIYFTYVAKCKKRRRIEGRRLTECPALPEWVRSARPDPILCHFGCAWAAVV